jgi:Bacterial Ig domain
VQSFELRNGAADSSCDSDLSGVFDANSFAPAGLDWTIKLDWQNDKTNRDPNGKVTLGGVQIVADISSVLGNAVCTYSGNANNTAATNKLIIGEVYNPDNTSSGNSELVFDGAPLARTSGSTPCGDTAGFTATYTLTGDAGQKLELREDPPVCTDVPTSTPYQTAVEIQLSCTGNRPFSFDKDSPAHGTITDFDSAAGTLTYKPNDGFSGTDSFGYLAANKGGDSNDAAVTIDVSDPPPVCTDVPTSTPYQTAVEIQLSCTGTGPFNFDVPSSTAHGTITNLDSSAGTLTYTPNNGYSGTDSFEYLASNDGGDSNDASVMVDVGAAPAGGGGGSGTPSGSGGTAGQSARKCKKGKKHKKGKGRKSASAAKKKKGCHKKKKHKKKA